MTRVQPVLTRNPGGTFHWRYSTNGQYLIDDRHIHDHRVGFDTVDLSALDLAEPEQLCGICFPRNGKKARR
jgi:hypothetical protein